ncbi:tRNA 2-selenouridine(34) synthase MnmH [Ferrimonas gelatinilytica]|uniref:tRNA 2-selenouridine synthase n=1 Tax=Ferrimonas gelatinilytica TaxID=1255257 RepID=A0ABP9SBR9_9GAMM
MTECLPRTAYAELLLGETPMIDLRAPVEFTKGAFPGAVNLPLMNDEERAAVGTCYKEQGQEAAIALGHERVGGAVKQARVDAWLAQVEAHPDSVLYCFRGGMRSQISQRWLAEAGIQRPYIEGGYKGMRSFLIEQSDQMAENPGMVIVAGMTGSGKTDFLVPRNDAVDLEGLAHHRGSSFGRQLIPQPSQINFENRLAIALMQHRRRARQLVLEDESRLIGRTSLPIPLFDAMKAAPRVILEVTTEERIEQILKDYVVEIHAAFVERDGTEAGGEGFCEFLLASLDRIQRRLGNERHQALRQLMTSALSQQLQQGELTLHREWIAQLLSEYYDPMYHFQMGKQPAPVLYRGPKSEVREFLDQREATLSAGW